MNNHKITHLNDLEQITRDLKNKKKVVGLCHGTFDLLHIGHIKHFYEAKSKCDILLVTLTPDKYVNKGPGRPLFNEKLRAEAIAALECVDFVAVNHWPTAVKLISKIQPNIYIKGKDYVNLKDDLSGNILLEKKAVESYGGKLQFTTSEKFSSSNLIAQDFSDFNEDQKTFIKDLQKDFEPKYFYEVMDRCKKIAVGVVGELIVDQYIYCETVGKSGKEPMLVHKVNNTDKFLGGVGALGQILTNFVSRIDIITCVGENEEEIDFIKDNYPSNGKIFYIRKSDSPTIVKTRYINDYTKLKLIGFYDINDNMLSETDEKKFQQILLSELKKYDVVIEIDYGHGLISKSSQNLIRSKSSFFTSNSQINSFNYNFHDLSQYTNLDLLCINESELYSHFRARSGPIKDLMYQLKEELKCRNLIITRGSKGSIGLDKNNQLINCPSFTNKIVDRVGAGDAYLGSVSITLAAGATLKAAMFFSSILAGEIVSSMGTGKAIYKDYIWKSIEAVMKRGD